METGEGRTPRPKDTPGGCATGLSGALFLPYLPSADRMRAGQPAFLSLPPTGRGTEAPRIYGARYPASRVSEGGRSCQFRQLVRIHVRQLLFCCQFIEVTATRPAIVRCAPLSNPRVPRHFHYLANGVSVPDPAMYASHKTVIERPAVPHGAPPGPSRGQ